MRVPRRCCEGEMRLRPTRQRTLTMDRQHFPPALLPKCDARPCDWQTRPENRYRRSPSLAGKAFPGGQVRRTIYGASEPKEGLPSCPSRLLELFANDPSLWSPVLREVSANHWARSEGILT